jgi:hypothetical protein
MHSDYKHVFYISVTPFNTSFGAPHILQSHNGREFTANIIKELKDMCQIVLWFMVNQDTLSHKEVLKGVTLI